jgi:hypothetical protein
MRSYSLLASTLFAATLVGCAISRPAPAPVVVAPAPAATTATAQAPAVVRTAQIVAVEGGAPAAPGAAPSSGSTGGTTAGGSPTRLTVRFADGTQSEYEVAQPATNFRVGQPVSVISNGSAITIMR